MLTVRAGSEADEAGVKEDVSLQITERFNKARQQTVLLFLREAMRHLYVRTLAWAWSTWKCLVVEHTYRSLCALFTIRSLFSWTVGPGASGDAVSTMRASRQYRAVSEQMLS